MLVDFRTQSRQIAYPERQCVALVGDGGFTMLMGEFVPQSNITANHRGDREDNSLEQIKWEQLIFLGNPDMVASYRDRLVKFAEACAVSGIAAKNLMKSFQLCIGP